MSNSLKAVILAGGFGTRISEETHSKPKPMIEIGGKPILWHIMKSYAHYGIEEFIICCGYKGYLIKEYFSNYYLHMSDLTFDFASNEVTYHQNYAEKWRVTLIDTGETTMTGGRLKRIQSLLDPDLPFCMTYGDGVSNIDIKRLVDFHQSHGKLATVTSVQPPGRFGVLQMDGQTGVTGFKEKPSEDGARINGGFFVLSPKVIDYISGDETVWEDEPLSSLASEGQLQAFQHDGFWQPMDTLREKTYLETLYQSGEAPWVKWS